MRDIFEHHDKYTCESALGLTFGFPTGLCFAPPFAGFVELVSSESWATEPVVSLPPLAFKIYYKINDRVLVSHPSFALGHISFGFLGLGFGSSIGSKLPLLRANFRFFWSELCFFFFLFSQAQILHTIAQRTESILVPT
jgi:hypothetical protein